MKNIKNITKKSLLVILLILVFTVGRFWRIIERLFYHNSVQAACCPCHPSAGSTSVSSSCGGGEDSSSSSSTGSDSGS